MTTATQRDARLQQCIDNCTECHNVCIETVQYCLEMGGKHAEAQHIRRLLDCAEICALSADYMLRGSDMHRRTCAVCADACERCAQDCERFGDDEMMRRCAEICRACAQSCREMAR
ncbi:MAG TPA: four-helix bundle copper-binding protein [Dehalococcoidia bacterium]|nr:four-helix bundle copper-binding protein [Dehalococcoidia bacterium]